MKLVKGRIIEIADDMKEAMITMFKESETFALQLDKSADFIGPGQFIGF